VDSSAVGATLIKNIFGIKRNPVFPQKPDKFIFKGHSSMMPLLVSDIAFYHRYIRGADALKDKRDTGGSDNREIRSFAMG
jgi:hypothetical protein